MIKKGNLLIAEPTDISDQKFNRSVILLVNHNESGSMGFILNKKTEYSTKKLSPSLNFKFPIYSGGPVQQDSLYFIHNKPELIPNSLKVKNEIYWGGDFKKVINLINNKKIKPGEIKFFLGYSGWHKNQLENEIKLSSWIIKKENKNDKLLFEHCENIWKDNLTELGGNYIIWSNSPDNPTHN